MSHAPLVEQVYADFAAKNLDAIANVFAPNIQWTVSDGFPYAGTYTGFNQIKAGVFAKVPTDWDGFHHKIHHTTDCGNDILITGTYHGTWKPTGKTIEAPFVHHWTLENGKVIRFHQYVDLPATKAATDGFVHAGAMTQWTTIKPFAA